MIGTPRKPGTPTLKPSTSLGTKSTSRTLSSSTAKPAAPRATAAKTSLGRSATGIVDRAASAAKSARIYGGGAGSTPTRTTSTRTTTSTARPGPGFGNVRSGVSTTAAPVRKSVFGNVVGGVISSAASAPRALPSTYTVLQGDSLSKIAKRLYGRASAWRKLFEANRDQIDDADLIHPGQVLRVPEL